MTQPLQWGTQWFRAIRQLMDAMEAVKPYQAMIAANSSLTGDSTVPGSYLNAPGARTDLVAFDMGAAYASINYLLEAYDTATQSAPPAPTLPAPTKDYLFKVWQ